AARTRRAALPRWRARSPRTPADDERDDRVELSPPWRRGAGDVPAARRAARTFFNRGGGGRPRWPRSLVIDQRRRTHHRRRLDRQEPVAACGNVRCELAPLSNARNRTRIRGKRTDNRG